MTSTMTMLNRATRFTTPVVRRRILALLACAGATLAPVRIVAQEAPLIRLAFDDECAGSASTGLGDALLSRMPDARFGSGDGGWTLAWMPDGGTCALVLTRGDVEHRLPLASDADADTLEQAASRIAWWLASEASNDETDGSAAGADVVEDVSPQEPERPELRRVPVMASVVPSLAAPSYDEPVRANFAFHIIGSAEEELDGFELALGWNHLRGWGRGFQMSTLANVTDDEFRGMQYTSGLNLSRGEFRGVQAGFANVALGDMYGGQLGAVNVAGRLAGAQMGTVNVADTASFQFGLVNVANSADASIGLVSVVRDQPLYVNVGGNADSMVTFGLRHGSVAVQNIIEVEVNADLPELMTIGYGLGGHFGRGRVFGEIDAIARGVLNTARTGDLVYRGIQGHFRATVGYRFARRLAIVGGPTYTLFAARKGRVDQTPTWSNVIYDDPANADVVLGWAGAYVGLRF